MEEHKTLLERVGSAMDSGNLAYGKDDAIRDVEVLAALGMSGAQANKLASVFVHFVVAGDANALNDVRAAVREIVRRHDVAQGWNMSKNDKRRIEADVVLYLSSRACPTCKGVAFQRIPGAPMLSAARCQTCGGSGERVFLARLRAACHAALSTIEKLMANLQSDVRDRIFGRADRLFERGD